MSYQVIQTLLEQQLALTPGNLPTAFENVLFVPTSGVPYQRVYLMPARTSNPTFGSDFRRELGILQITVCYPTRAGRQAAQAQAEAISVNFKRGTSMISGTTRVLIDSSPFIAPAREEGAWFTIAVSVPYFADVFS